MSSQGSGLRILCNALVGIVLSQSCADYSDGSLQVESEQQVSANEDSDDANSDSESERVWFEVRHGALTGRQLSESLELDQNPSAMDVGEGATVLIRADGEPIAVSLSGEPSAPVFSRTLSDTMGESGFCPLGGEFRSERFASARGAAQGAYADFRVGSFGVLTTSLDSWETKKLKDTMLAGGGTAIGALVCEGATGGLGAFPWAIGAGVSHLDEVQSVFVRTGRGLTCMRDCKRFRRLSHLSGAPDMATRPWRAGI